MAAWSDVAIAVIGLLGGGSVATAITLVATKRKTAYEAIDIGAHAAGKIAEVAISMLVPLTAEVKRLGTVNEECQKDRMELRKELSFEREEVDRLKNRVTILENARG